MCIKSFWSRTPVVPPHDPHVVTDFHVVQHNLRDLATFEDLQDKFLQLFHRQFAQRELIDRFYDTYQEAHETVPQLII